MDPDDGKLLASLPFNFILFGAFCAIYAVLHTLFFDQFYKNPLERKTDAPTPQTTWRRNPFAPLYFVWRMTDDDFIKYAGLDAWALIEFTGMVIKILVGYGLYGLTVMIVCVAVAWVENSPWQIQAPKGTLARVSFANMREFGDLATARWDRWLGGFASVVGIWILTILTISLLKRSWLRLVDHRQHALADARDTSSLTILVRHGEWVAAPPGSPMEVHKARYEWKVHKETDARALWERLFPGCIYDVRVVRDTKKLPKLLKTRDKLTKAIKSLEDKKANPATKPKALEKAVAQLETKRALLAANTEEVKTVYADVSPTTNAAGSSYFVLFKKHRQCNIAKQAVNTADEGMEVFPCPPLTDIRWDSLRPMTEKVLPLTKLGSAAGYYATLAFYIVPISFVSGLLTIFQLEQTFPFLKPVFNAMGTTIMNILAAFLPTLALLVFLALLPMFCLFIAGFQGFPSLGMTSRDQFSRLFLFQFVWVFLGVTMVSGGFALVEKLSMIIKSPLSILTILGDQLAGNAVFFMIYLSVQFCSGLPMFHSRVVQVAIWWLMRRAQNALEAAQEAAKAAGNLANKSRQESREATRKEDKPVPPEQFPYAVNWCKVMLASCLGICYAPIQPICILFAVAHLSLAYVYFKRALLYSFTHASESRGAFWPVASARLLVILFFCQLMLVGVHSLKGGIVTAVLVALTIPFTYSANKYFTRHYEKHLDVLPLEFSVGNDEDDEKKEAASRRATVARLSMGGRMSLEDAEAVALREQERTKWSELFDGCFVQPELVEARKIVRDAGGTVPEEPAAGDKSKAPSPPEPTPSELTPSVTTEEVSVKVVR